MYIQGKLLEKVKQLADPRVSYVDELSDLLEISRDSVYRRLRGETEMSLNEALKICDHYGIPLSELDNAAESSVTFNTRLANNSNFRMHEWLQTILTSLETILKYPGEKQLVYYTKDLPIFYFFKYPKIGAFKIYFWMQTILDEHSGESPKFSIDAMPKDLLAMGERIWDKYRKVPSLEIWADESLIATLKQVTYYFECGYFENPKDAITILDELELMVEESKEWLRSGRKDQNATLRVYRNDIILGDNSILFRLDDKRMAYIPILAMSLLSTTNERITSHFEEFLDVIIRRSALISDTGEKERNTFITKNKRYINEYRNKIEALGGL